MYSIVVAQSVYLRHNSYTDKRKCKDGHSKGLAMMTTEDEITAQCSSIFHLRI